MRKGLFVFVSVVPVVTFGCAGVPGENYDPAFESERSDESVGQTAQAIDTGDWALGGNTLTAVGRIGSNSNHAIELEVNGLRALKIEPALGAEPHRRRANQFSDTGR